MTDEWVLVSPHRTKRPWQGQKEGIVVLSQTTYDPTCYLCPGNERAGGLRNPDYGDTYVFQNDFAAIYDHGQTTETSKGLLRMQEETGICKVICFSPDHSKTLPEMEVSEVRKVIRTWEHEFELLSRMELIANVQIFENKGSMMGCSNPHPHGQIWAQSAVPNEIVKRTKTQQAYFEANKRSLLADYLDQELEDGSRIIAENDHFVSLVPFWAVWPYETMILPRRHFQSLAEMSLKEETSFAESLLDVTRRYDNLFETSFPYSAGMQQRPTDGGNHEGWHFHYVFYPPLLRSATVRKFMVGYEMFANPQRDITPEQAASKLRSLTPVHYKTQRLNGTTI